MDHAQGAHKWDVDGNRYIDYNLGNGAMLLGHAHPAVIRAIQEQAPRGTHFGSDHPLMVRWAVALVRTMIVDGRHLATIVAIGAWLGCRSGGADEVMARPDPWWRVPSISF